MRSLFLSAALALASTATTTVLAQPCNGNAEQQEPEQICNGQASYCSKRYSEMTFAASHNSPFVGQGVADNQHSTVTEQLDMGIRFLQAATQNDGEDNQEKVQMCHTACWLEDAGTLKSYLQEVKTWLDANPDEVVSLLLTNGDGLDINLFGDAFEATGLDDMVFTPDGDGGDLALDEWPTLGEMISSGNRVVVFMDYDMDTSQVPYILDEFTYFFETPFSPTEDNFMQCDIDRPEDLSSADGRMFLMNHNLNEELFAGILVPAPDQASQTNSVASIMKQVNICRNKWGRAPNVVLLDFVNEGQVMNVQDRLNNQ